MMNSSRLPLLLPPLGQELHHLGVRLFKDPQVLLYNDVQLAVPPRIDERLELHTLRVVPLHHRAACTRGADIERLELQLPRASVLQLGVQAVPTALHLREGVAVLVAAVRHLPVVHRMLARAAFTHHPDVLQRVQGVLHICRRWRQCCDDNRPVRIVDEASSQQVCQARAPERHMLHLIFEALIYPLAIPVHDARAFFQHQQRVVDVAATLGHLPRVQLSLEISLGASEVDNTQSAQ
mmetsp:Transcript_53034/g.152832  ORF Transcript_53034/g.152832 Transcript_53034/m.152832 type:complete len:237 (-) Transcript_53034:1014-1724(-)